MLISTTRLGAEFAVRLHEVRTERASAGTGAGTTFEGGGARAEAVSGALR
ncbi:hypothetical protein ACFQ9X_29700 [Catenulispora yoronensis]